MPPDGRINTETEVGETNFETLGIKTENVFLVKTFIHEFARFRYGVFEEYGFEGEQFPYSFRNVRGDIQITGCNNTEITGEIHPM